MTFLIDTNVLSEISRPVPDRGVVTWLRDADEDGLFLSVASLAELRRGTERMPAGRRRVALEAWLVEDLLPRFDGRVLPIDDRVADTWGRVMARADAVGRPPGVMDAFFAATCEAYGLTLVTRNVRHFAPLGVATVDPWDPPEDQDR